MNDLLLPGHAEIEQAAKLVYAAMPATPQYSWPLLNAALGTETWVKHENHTPTGAFKVRGGLVYLQARRASGVISATRALGVTLVEHGKEFQESREHAVMLAQRDALHMIPSFHRDLVCGVATCWMELLRAQPDLDVLFVPIGQGSEICAAVAARRALNLRTRIIGVVSAHALAYKLSFESRSKVESPVTTLIADGVACRVPDESSLAVISDQVEEIMAVSDDEVAAAMKLYFTATHNVAEGAGAAALAAAMQIRPRLAGLRVGLALSGGNVDHDMFAQILSRPAVRTT